MRRTSWIDQRINDGAAVSWPLLRFDASFFWAMADWGAMADRRHHGEGEHHQ